MRKKLLMAIALLVSGVGNLWAGIHYTMNEVPSVDYSSKNATSLTSGKFYALYHVDGGKFFYANPSDNALYISSTNVTAFKFVSTSTDYYLLSDLGTVNKGSNDWTIKANGNYGNEGKWTATLTDGKYKLKNNGISGKFLGTDSNDEGSKCYRDKTAKNTWYIIDLSDPSLAVSLLFQLNKAYDEYYEKATDGDAKTALGAALDGVYNDYVKAASFDGDTYNAGIAAIGAAIGTYLDTKLPVDNSGVSLIDTKPTATGLDWNASESIGTGDNVAEYYNKKGATISRNIVLPIGYYRLTCIGLTRTDYTSVLSVSDLANMNIATVGSATVNTKAAADTWFGKGYGVNELDFHVTTAKEVNVCLTADNGESGDHWTVWKNFKLVYLGKTSDKLLNHEISLDGPIITAGNTAITTNPNVKGVELSNLNTAISDLEDYNDPGNDEENTAARKLLKYAVVDKTNILKDAAANYNSLASAISSAQAIVDAGTNVGSGVFQIPVSAQATLSSAIATASGVWNNASTTASDASNAVTPLNNAVTTYNSTPLNAPDPLKRYVLTFHKDGNTYDGNAATFIHNGRADEGNYIIQYTKATDINYAQAFKFTPVADKTDQYYLSQIDIDGNERYITTNKLGYSGSNAAALRTTTEENTAKYLPIKIEYGGTAGQYYLLNTTNSNNKIAYASDNNINMYTQNTATFSVAEASQASVTVAAKAGKYGTIILPFAYDFSSDDDFDDITFYSIDAIAAGKLTLAEVATPAANTPYIIKNDGGSDFSKELTNYGTAKQDSYVDANSYLTGVYTAQEIIADDDNYVLQTQPGGQAFYLVTGENFEATPYKAYLTYDGALDVKAFYFGDETAVSSVKADELQGATIYNLAGQRVSKAQKGVYIINGKKVAVK